MNCSVTNSSGLNSAVSTIASTCQQELTENELLVVVEGNTYVCSDIREITLISDTNKPLPSFTPGSHIAVTWGEGKRNSYSLTGSTLDPHSYSISVRLAPYGAGGSRRMHSLKPGDQIVISRPRNAFPPVATARKHLFIAGGIGITPILSHIRAALQWHREFQVIYSYRPEHGAHIAELRKLCENNLVEVHSNCHLKEAIEGAVRTQPWGAHLYTCGPKGMMEMVFDTAHLAGWSAERLHSEAFQASPSARGKPFMVRLKSSGKAFNVSADKDLLSVLLTAGVDVPNLCRQGICGECKTSVCSGTVAHGDSYLTEEEKTLGKFIMPCVSRALSDVLEVEL